MLESSDCNVLANTVTPLETSSETFVIRAISSTCDCGYGSTGCQLNEVAKTNCILVCKRVVEIMLNAK